MRTSRLLFVVWALAAGCGRVGFRSEPSDAAMGTDAARLDAGASIDAPVIMADAWASDASGADGWAPDGWAPDASLASTDGWAADGWAADAWAADGWAADAWAADGWAADAGSSLSSGLVGWYRFEGDTTDSAGGSDVPCATCVYFDGGVIPSSVVSIPDRPELASGSYTLALWLMVRTSQPTGTSANVLFGPDFGFESSRNSSGPPAGIVVYLPRGGGRGRSVGLDTWVHVAMTWDDAAMRFRSWLNGAGLDDQILGYRPATTSLRLGPNVPLDDLVMYTRALDASELAELAAMRR